MMMLDERERERESFTKRGYEMASRVAFSGFILAKRMDFHETTRWMVFWHEQASCGFFSLF